MNRPRASSEPAGSAPAPGADAVVTFAAGRVDEVLAAHGAGLDPRTPVPQNGVRPGVRTGGWLDDTERGRLAELRRAEDRERFVASRQVLKSLVGLLAGVAPDSVRLTYACPDCDRPHGRPRVAGPVAAAGWQVSIAHAADYVVVAAATAGEVGVDVEPEHAAGFEGFDDVALNDAERRAIEALAPAGRVAARTRLWVRKEAALKADGRGLRVDPAAALLAPVRVADIEVAPGYVAAVALSSTATSWVARPLSR